jgi:hypothetical protein
VPRVRRRPQHATVVAYLALFVALGGSSYAAVRIGSTEIVDNSVRSKDIRNNDVRSTDVLNGSLLAGDFKAGQLPAGPQGDSGPQGPQGPPGTTGAPGRAATSLFAYIRDVGPSGPATVDYGSGVISVDDPDGDSDYVVTFDRELTNCVGVATTGRGEPGGAAAGGVAFGEFVDLGPGGVVQVSLFDGSAAPVRKDGSFMIAVFC